MADGAGLMVTIDDETRRVARTFAPDLYLSALLAPRRAQPALIALAAFDGDIDRIILTVSEPSLAEIRLQWWRDALSNGLNASPQTTNIPANTPVASGSPVADAVIAAARANGLSFDGFDRALDARSLDLYADPLPGEAALEAWIDATAGHALRASARIIDDATAATVPAQALIAASAAAIGRTRLLCATAALLARGRPPFPSPTPFPTSAPSPLLGADPETGEALRAMVQLHATEVRDKYDTAKQHWRAAPEAARLACLPLGLVPSYLSAVTAPGHDPRRSIAVISPLTRVWRLWRARRLGLV
jgi:phytoene synthase